MGGNSGGMGSSKPVGEEEGSREPVGEEEEEGGEEGRGLME